MYDTLMLRETTALEGVVIGRKSTLAELYFPTVRSAERARPTLADLLVGAYSPERLTLAAIRETT